ncbi:urease accessory protein UreD [Streptomyces sp. NPDC057729]
MDADVPTTRRGAVAVFVLPPGANGLVHDGERARSGTLTSRLTVYRAGRPLIDQQTAYGPGAPGGWDGPAVLGGHRAVGQLLLVGPSFDDKCPEVRLLGATAVLTPLAGPAVLVTALAPDARLLRGTQDSAMNDVLGASEG